MGAGGWERGDAIVGTVWGMEHEAESNFFLRSYFKKNFILWLKYFFHINMEAWMRGGIIWFVVCFLTTYFCWCGSLGTEAWWWKQFFWGYVFKYFFIVWIKWFFLICHRRVGRVVMICLEVCFQTSYFHWGRVWEPEPGHGSVGAVPEKWDQFFPEDLSVGKNDFKWFYTSLNQISACLLLCGTIIFLLIYVENNFLLTFVIIVSSFTWNDSSFCLISTFTGNITIAGF